MQSCKQRLGDQGEWVCEEELSKSAAWGAVDLKRLWSKQLEPSAEGDSLGDLPGRRSEVGRKKKNDDRPCTVVRNGKEIFETVTPTSGEKKRGRAGNNPLQKVRGRATGTGPLPASSAAKTGVVAVEAEETRPEASARPKEPV